MSGVSVPPDYQDILDYLDTVLGMVRERYKRATKLDAYKYRLDAARAVRDALMAAPRPRLRIVPGGIDNDKPVLEDMSVWYATSPRYDKPPRIRDIEPVFTRWENLALAPVRVFARPEGLDIHDIAATRISEAGVYIAGVLLPVGDVGDGKYRFCDNNDCYDVPYTIDNDNDYVLFDFTGFGAKIRAAEATEEIAQDCDFHSKTGRVKAAIKIIGAWQAIIGKSVFDTIRYSLEKLASGGDPVPVVQSFPRAFIHHAVAAACGSLSRASYDELDVKKAAVCMHADPYVIDIDNDGVHIIVSGIGGYQTYKYIDYPFPPCGDYEYTPPPAYEF